LILPQKNKEKRLSNQQGIFLNSSTSENIMKGITLLLCNEPICNKN
jgi:hypothetical protein